eukprot:5810495-Amphidinium_carterae.1
MALHGQFSGPSGINAISPPRAPLPHRRKGGPNLMWSTRSMGQEKLRAFLRAVATALIQELKSSTDSRLGPSTFTSSLNVSFIK